MSSEQAGLDQPGIAEELAESQREISIAEFFEKNKHMLGFDSGARALITAVKEAVDNALDATEEARILPEVSVEITHQGDYYQITVEDNGPGIPKDKIPNVFGKLLYGSRFGARRQARGQQGIGISAAVLYSQLTSGTPAKITSKSKANDTAEFFELVIDTDTNEPEIRTADTTDWNREHGTRIELELEANMRARPQLHRYIRNTAVVNPHAELSFMEPGLDEPMAFPRSTDELPAETEEIKPHPHGVELGTLLKMLEATDSNTLSGFLKTEFTRVGSKTADEILDNFRDAEYGRESVWTLPDEHSLHDVICDVVNGKSESDTEEFATRVTDKIPTDTPQSYTDIRTIVDTVAEDVESDCGTRFGDTVKTNTVTAIWGVFQQNRWDVLRDAVEDATSSRKTTETLDAFTVRLADKYSDVSDQTDTITESELRQFVDRVADTTENADNVSFGDTARENITDAIWTRMQTVTTDVPLVREVVDDRETARNLETGMQSANVMAPPSSCLAPIGEDNIMSGLQSVYDGADFYSSNTRTAEVTGGDPFIAEAGIAYGGNLATEQAGKTGDVLRFANRVPLVYSRGGCASVDAIKNIRWKTYEVDQPGDTGLPTGPIVVLVHIASTNVPFTNESKDALAHVPIIEKEIEQAVRGAAKDLRTHLKEQNRLSKRRKKEETIGPVLSDMASKLTEMTDRESIPFAASEARIMNNLFLDVGSDADGVSITIRNHTTQNADPEVVLTTTEEPAESPESMQVTETSDGWEVRWTLHLDPDAETTQRIPGAGSKTTVSVSNFAAEKVTLNE